MDAMTPIHYFRPTPNDLKRANNIELFTGRHPTSHMDTWVQVQVPEYPESLLDSMGNNMARFRIPYLYPVQLLMEDWKLVEVIEDVKFCFHKANYTLVLDITEPTSPFITMIVRDAARNTDVRALRSPEKLCIMLNCRDINRFRVLESMLPEFTEGTFGTSSVPPGYEAFFKGTPMQVADPKVRHVVPEPLVSFRTEVIDYGDELAMFGLPKVAINAE